MENEEVNAAYPGRSGTLNEGKEYEWSLLAYCGVLLLNPNIADGWIATEPQTCGDFDDVIVYCKWEPCNYSKEEIFLVQCKHSTTKKTIKIGQFINSSKDKDFFLEKYMNTYNRELYSCLSKSCDSLVSDTIGRLWDQIKCILFTNNEIDAEDIFEETTYTSSLSLNTSEGKTNVHKCKTGKLHSLIVKKTLADIIINDKLWKAISEVTLNKVILIQNIDKTIAAVKVHHIITKDKLNNAVISKVRRNYVPLQRDSKENLKAAISDELNKVLSKTSFMAVISEKGLDQIIANENLTKSISKNKLIQMLRGKMLSTIVSKETVQELITPCFELNFEFLYEKLFIFSNQMKNKDMSRIITNELSKTLKLKNMFDFEFHAAVRNYMTFIANWAQRKLGGSYNLTKTYIINKITELMLESYSNMPPLYKNVDLVALPRIENWHQIIQGKGVILIDLESEEAKFVTQFLHCYLDSKVRQYDLGRFLRDNWATGIGNTERDRPLKEEMLRTVHGNERPSLIHISKVLWKCKLIPLVLEVKSLEDYENVLAILELSEYKLNAIVIYSNREKFPFTDKSPDFQHLSDTTGNARQLALEGRMNLQGRPMKLNTLITKYQSLDRFVTTKDIMYTFDDKLNVGNTPQNLPKYFVERSVTPTLLDIKLVAELLDKSSDLYVVKGINKSDFCKYLERQPLQIDPAIVTDFPQGNQQRKALKRYKIITNDCQFLTDEIVKTTTEAKNIHYLILHKDSATLQWVRTIGSTTAIRPYRLKSKPDYMMEYCSIAKQLMYLKNQITVISANPGMGKSTMMDYIASTTSIDYWILQVNLKEYTNTYYSESMFEEAHENPANHLTYFNNQILTKQKCNSPLNREAFAQFLKLNSLLVILDGFDEISPDYKDQVTAMTRALVGNGYRLVITTRPVLKRYLEREFDVIAVTLNPITDKDQVRFLTAYFKSTLCIGECKETILHRFVEKLLVLAQKNLNDWEQEFTGVPLQTELLADAFEDDCRKYLEDQSYTLREHFDLLDLYESFAEKKIKILSQKLPGFMYKPWEMYQKRYALKVLFPRADLADLKTDEQIRCSFFEPLQKNGIMVSEDEVNLTFIHRTFAEYFAAKWLSENWKLTQARPLLKLIFEADYVITRNIFDRLLVKTDLHKAIINRHVDHARYLIRGSPGLLDISDKGGRLPVHLMAAWGNRRQLSKQTDIPDVSFNGNEMTSELMEQLLMEVCRGMEKLPRCNVLGYTPLDYAVASESVGCLNAILSKFNVEPSIPGGKNDKDYIYYSSRYGYTSLIKRILDGCKDVTTAKEYFNSPLDRTFSRTALQWASFEGNKDIVELLLSDTVDRKHFIDVMLSRIDLHGKTALHLAVEHDHYGIVALLLSRGGNPEAKDNSGYSPLHIASRHGTNDSLRMLSQNIVNINLPDSNENTPLHLAALGGHNENVQFLLQWNADAELKNSDQQTALHIASTRGHTETMGILLNENCKILDSTDRNGNTSLHLSAKNGHATAVELLMLKKSDLSIVNGEGNTALHLAAEGGHAKIVKMLLTDASINMANGNGNTPLHVALINNHPVTASELLQSCASINQRNNQGRTALHEAVVSNCEIIGKLLSEPDIDLLAKDNDGRTALHLAAMGGNVKLVSLFLQRDMDVDGRDACGCTALHLAATEGLAHVVTFLLSEKANVNAKDQNQSTSLHFAAANGREDVVKVLLSCAAVSIDSANEQGRTALHVASENGQRNIISLLLQKQANTELVDRSGYTAMSLAGIKGYVNLFDSVEHEIFI